MVLLVYLYDSCLLAVEVRLYYAYVLHRAIYIA